MARYIDADKYVEYLEKEICSKCIDEVCGACGLDSARWIAEEFSTEDVVPKSEVDKWQGRCREWHEVAELKSNYIMELDEGLAKANAEIKRLHGILLQFTDIVHKWGARNGIDTSEISLVPILQKEADGIVGKMEQEIETLKDNNEHLAVLLTEAKQEVAKEIFEEIESIFIDGCDYYHTMEIGDFAELKKKYTEAT